MTYNYNCCACFTKNEKVANMNKGEHFLIMSNRFKGFFTLRKFAPLTPLNELLFLVLFLLVILI